MLGLVELAQEIEEFVRHCFAERIVISGAKDAADVAAAKPGAALAGPAAFD